MITVSVCAHCAALAKKNPNNPAVRVFCQQRYSEYDRDRDRHHNFTAEKKDDPRLNPSASFWFDLLNQIQTGSQWRLVLQRVPNRA